MIPKTLISIKIMEDEIDNNCEEINEDSYMLQSSLGTNLIENYRKYENDINEGNEIIDTNRYDKITNNNSVKDLKAETCHQESLDVEKIILEGEVSSEQHSFAIKERNGVEVYVCENSNQEYASYDELNSNHVEDLKEIIEYIHESDWEPIDNINECVESNILNQIKEESSDDNDENQEEFQIIEDSENYDIQVPENNDVQISEDQENEIEYLADMLEAEDDIEKYFCEKCEIAFDTLAIAEKHRCNDVEEPEDINCLECNLVFKTSKEFDIHTGNEHLAKPETCDYCLESFMSIRAFYRHKLVDHGIQLPFQCQNCHKIFKSFQSLLNHMKKVCRILKKSSVAVAKTPVTCEICNTKITSEKGLKFHMRTHQVRVKKSIQDVLPAAALDEYRELNQFHCDTCNKSFDQNLLEIHKKMHLNIVEHCCKVCNRQFPNRVLYDMHMQLHAQQTNQQNRFPFRTEDANGKKLNHLCQYCGRGFGKPYEKVKHERIHTGEKPYECEVCGKSFRISYSLTMHLRSHTDIRPFHCTVCNKRFKSKPTYAHHLRSHEDVRAYKCDYCPKTFRTSVRLNAHRNSHSKPFSCPVCAKRFASLHSTKIHMKTHGNTNTKVDEDQKQTCSICGTTFDRAFALLLHMQDVHEIQVHFEGSDDEEENGNENVLHINEELRILQEDVSEIYEDIPMDMEEVQLTEEIPHEEAVCTKRSGNSDDHRCSFTSGII